MNAWVLPVVSIIAITTLLLTALLMGHNGTLLASGLAIISGLGGFSLAANKAAKLKKRIKELEESNTHG